MMKKFYSLLTLLFISHLAMAQSQFFYEWKDDVITIRTVSEVDSLNFPSSNYVANFTTGSPSSLTSSSMVASYSLAVSGIVPLDMSRTEVGVCYSFSNPVPTVDDYKMIYGTLEEGTWEVTLKDLYSSTLYHYCPYLILGDMVYYGPIKSFTTLKHSTSSLWNLLENRSDLSKFREIVAKAPFYSTDTHRAYSTNGSDTIFYTFKDVLSAQSDMTLWAPANSALSEEEWAKFKTMADNGDYLLQLQLMGNHMAMGSKVMSNSGKGKVGLLNGKTATIDYDASKLQNALIAEKDISARNGVMHVLKNVNEYKYNLYEYIKYSGKVNTFGEYLAQRDTLSPSLSIRIKGLPDVNGNNAHDEYIYLQDNLMFRNRLYNPTQYDAHDEWMTNMKMFNADINAEDSAFVMIIPTDKAWKDATERLAPYYRYADAYPKMNKLVAEPRANYLLTLDNARYAFANGHGYGTVDSLQAANIEMDMIYPLVFNARAQKGNGGAVWTAKEFLDNYMNCEYLLTTTGDTIRDIYENLGGEEWKVWEMASLFQDGVVEVKEMSNGYAIITDTWNFPSDYFMRDVDVEANPYVYKKVSLSTNLTEREMNNILAKDWIDDYGRVSLQRYLHVMGYSVTAENKIVFQLNGSKYGQADVMSGKYDIMAVMVPIWYKSSAETPDIPETIYKSKLTFNLYYWDETLKEAAASKGYGYSNQTKQTVSWEFHNEKVDTLMLFEDFEFPVSYRNVRNSYPVLEIVSKVTSTQSRQGYTSEYCIDRIILKAKETE